MSDLYNQGKVRRQKLREIFFNMVDNWILGT